LYNDDGLLEKWCKEWEIDYQLARRLKGIFFPLLEEAHKRIGYRFNKAFLEQKEGMDLRLANSKRIMLLLKKLNPQDFSTEERKAISLHLEYITTVEGFLAPQINFLIFLLIANGHDFRFSRNGKCAETLRDIEKINFSKKLAFLGKHGFKELSKNKDDILSLRNSAAHLFYEIDANGTIRVGHKKITEETYAKLYDYLRDVADSLHLLTRLYYKRFASFKPQTKLKKIKCTCGYVNLVPEVRNSGSKSPLRCTNCKKIIR
jgi:hypothetical protein